MSSVSKSVAAAVIAALGAAALLAACGGGGERDLAVADFAISAYQGAEAIGGEETTLAAALEHADKPIVLNFWAGLCPPCRAEMPHFQEVYDERSDEVLLLGIDVGPFQLLGTREEGRALLREMDIDYPAGTTYQETILRDLEILGMPTTFFIRRDGSLQAKWAGLLTKDKLNELIDETL